MVFSFSQNLSWKHCITSTAKVASKDLSLHQLSSSLTGSLQLVFSLHCRVASLSLFYRYYPEISQCMLRPLRRACNPHQATQFNTFSLQFYTIIQELIRTLFFTYTSHQLGNTLPLSIFSLTVTLISFKRNVSRHLEFDLAWFWTFVALFSL